MPSRGPSTPGGTSSTPEKAFGSQTAPTLLGPCPPNAPRCSVPRNASVKRCPLFIDKTLRPWQLSPLLQVLLSVDLLITWEFPRLCRGGSRSLTYTAVVRRRSSWWRDTKHADGSARPSITKLRQGEHSEVRLFPSASVGYLSKVAMPSSNLPCDSVIGTGGASPASQCRFERLTN
jgi:hypothetical protein